MRGLTMDLTIVSPFITTQKMFLEVPFIHSIILLLILKKDLFFNMTTSSCYISAISLI